MNVSFIQSLKKLKFLGLDGNLIGDPSPLLELSPSTFILANDNPFYKKLCLQNVTKVKHGEDLKNCFFNGLKKQNSDKENPVSFQNPVVHKKSSEESHGSSSSL